MNTVEILEQAKIDLRDTSKPFHFGDWDKCTCGFIRAADPDQYTRVIQDTAAALGHTPRMGDGDAPGYVSEYTRKLAHESPDATSVNRTHALETVRTAIQRIDAGLAK